MSIELIPWIHNTHSPHHNTVLKYIRTIPKGSTLAFESFPSYTRLLNQMKDLMSGKTPSKERGFAQRDGPLNTKTLDSFTLAMVEVLHECEKRGIEILPAQSNVAGIRSMGDAERRYGSVSEMLLTTEKDSLRREKDSAKIVANQARKKNIYFLIGAGHILSIQEELKALGVSSRVRLSIFGKKRNSILSLMTLNKKHRKLVLSRHFEDAHKVYEKLDALYTNPRKQDELNRRRREQALRKSLQEHAKKQKERIQKRIRSHKK